ncbi:hypothetical protein GIB67_007695 [Kingdonia uniflora]|uniref:peptidylprolyl isomerase n=1 Tax=Kingdonia uniflora TaxID=39325 RepID=A0A7J7N1X4_9MAGN|nr:hypothetical protein GIB67_007695 [Kingdonia uniflora]
MAEHEESAEEYMPKKSKSSLEEENEKRRKKIVAGSLMKAEMRPGSGTAKPADGDQVIYHSTIRTLDGVVVESTRSELGGKGIPIRQILGKSKMLLGLLEGIPSMLKGEVAMFKMKPELHYAEVDCPVETLESFPKLDELHFEIELIDFSKVRVIKEDMGVVKKVIKEGEGWESPREPYEVKAWISAKTGDGKLILSHTQGDPFSFTFGKAEVPKGLEIGIGAMTRGEKAVIYVSNHYLNESRLMPGVEDFDELQFEVDLVHFIQVRDMLGDGRLIKRRIRDGKGDFPMDCPLHDSLLHMHYKGMLLNEEGTVFYDTRVDNNDEPLHFSSGEGLVPEGLEMCLRLMLPGEVALVTCPPDYAYDKFTRPPSVPEGAHVQWEIELLGFEKPKEREKAIIMTLRETGYCHAYPPSVIPSCLVIRVIGGLSGQQYTLQCRQITVTYSRLVSVLQEWTGLSFESIMEEAESIKNTQFGEGSWLRDGGWERGSGYTRLKNMDMETGSLKKESTNWLKRSMKRHVLREYNHVNPQDDNEGKIFLNSRNSFHLNVAACYLKLGECKKSIESCNKVLDSSPAHVKALYRRGMAYMSAGDFDEARSDFKAMITADKSSEPDATSALLRLKLKEQEVEKKAKKQFKGLFDKKPGEISDVGVESSENQIADGGKDSSENQKPEDEKHDISDQGSFGGEEADGIHEAGPPRRGLFARFLPGRLFPALGLNRCSIL